MTRDRSAARKDMRLVTCALLLELVHADSAYSAEERRQLEEAVRTQFGLDSAAAERLLNLAEKARAEDRDLRRLTSFIAAHYSDDQKAVLLAIMWRLIHADGDLHRKEAYLIRKICSLLRMDPGWGQHSNG
jgi:uncharacterized tellurite resistance protein B-like protein